MVRYPVSARIVGNAIPHNWSMTIGSPFSSLIFPTNAPVIGSKALIVPAFVLFETNSLLLSGPKFGGATATPPRLIQRCALDQRLHKCAVFLE